MEKCEERTPRDPARRGRSQGTGPGVWGAPGACGLCGCSTYHILPWGGGEGGAARCRRFCCYSFTEGSQVSEAPSCSSALLGLISLPSAHLAQLAAPLFRVTVQRGPASLDISHTLWVFNTRSLTKMRWCLRVLASEPGLLGSRHGMMAFHQTGQLRHASHCNHTSDPSDEGLRQDRSAHPTCAELSWLPPGGPPGAHSRTACSKQTADIYRHPGH